jgi:hypothetical protein
MCLVAYPKRDALSALAPKMEFALGNHLSEIAKSYGSDGDHRL